MTLAELMLEFVRKNRRAVLVTVVTATGSTPAKPGSRMLVFENGEISGTIGGGSLEHDARREAVRFLGSQETSVQCYDLQKDLAMSCGGQVTLFYEPLAARRNLIVFGAGHIGRALIVLAKMLDFHITVVDNRPEFANSEQLPQADQIVAKPYSRALAELEWDADAYIVIVTHGHEHDQEVLTYCATKPFAYLGMIGSRSKVSTALTTLIANGVPKEAVSRIHTPIGLDLGGSSPAEIAVAIAAEWIALKYQRTEIRSLSVADRMAQ